MANRLFRYTVKMIRKRWIFMVLVSIVTMSSSLSSFRGQRKKLWRNAQPRCERLYKHKGCDIQMKISAQTRSTNNGTHYVRAGQIYVEHKKIASWTEPSFDVTVLYIGNNCDVTARGEFAASKNAHHVIEQRNFVRNISRRDEVILVAGFGAATNVGDYQLFGHVGKKLLSTSQDGAFLLVGRRDYHGHVILNYTKHANESISLFTVFSIGVDYKPVEQLTTYGEVIGNHSDMDRGGLWVPRDCVPRWRVAILVHLRDREQQLMIFLLNMISFLKQQELEFKIFVIEQAGSELFNRAALMNTGYLLSKHEQFDCYIFHDVDLLPEDLTNYYGCSDQPRHLSVTRRITKYRLKYYYYFGGAISMMPHHIELINGFPNRFWGWGGEDDDIYTRLTLNDLEVYRCPQEIGRYISLGHQEEDTNPHIKRNLYLIRSSTPYLISRDGLNSLHYDVINTSQMETYTRFVVLLRGPSTLDELNPAEEVTGAIPGEHLQPKDVFKTVC